MTGIVVLVLALAAALAFGLFRRHTDGRFGPVAEARETTDGRPAAASNDEADAGRAVVANDDGAEVGRVAVVGNERRRIETTTWSHITAALPDAEAGGRATLVQFSSAFCAPCRTTRVVLADIAEQELGVRHLEVDAEKHLDLVRALDVRRTPTTLVLDGAGRELVRAAGAPQKQQVLAVLPTGA